MLIQFKVKNFMSIKEDLLINMKANYDSSHTETLISLNDKLFLPTLAIYGANASGKSNIVKAFSFAIRFVRESSAILPTSLINVTPFLFDDKSISEPSEFEFLFLEENNTYKYGFSLNRTEVYEEYLYEYKTSQPTLIFHRNRNLKTKFGVKAKKELEEIEKRTSINKLLLSSATTWNSKLTSTAFSWFTNKIDSLDTSFLKNREAFFDRMEFRASDPDFKDFLKKLLHNSDSNISDYSFSAQHYSKEEAEKQLGIRFDTNSAVIPNIRTVDFQTTHRIKGDHGENLRNLPFEVESDGTQLFVSLGTILYDTLINGKTLIIDEIDSSLHPLLVQYIIGVFSDKSINKNNAQLLFTTHDVTLLDLNKFRRDQIYFVEKDRETGGSSLYTLSSLSVRKDENIFSGYMTGKYGAIPIIVEGELFDE